MEAPIGYALLRTNIPNMIKTRRRFAALLLLTLTVCPRVETRKEGRRLKAHWMAEPSQDLSLSSAQTALFSRRSRKRHFGFGERRMRKEGCVGRVLRGKERGEKKGGAREGRGKEGLWQLVNTMLCRCPERRKPPSASVRPTIASKSKLNSGTPKVAPVGFGGAS